MRTLEGQGLNCKKDDNMRGFVRFKDETAEFAQDGTQLVERCGLPDIYYAMVYLLTRAGLQPSQMMENGSGTNWKEENQINYALDALYASKTIQDSRYNNSDSNDTTYANSNLLLRYLINGLESKTNSYYGNTSQDNEVSKNSNYLLRSAITDLQNQIYGLQNQIKSKSLRFNAVVFKSSILGYNICPLYYSVGQKASFIVMGNSNSTGIFLNSRHDSWLMFNLQHGGSDPNEKYITALIDVRDDVINNISETETLMGVVDIDEWVSENCNMLYNRNEVATITGVNFDFVKSSDDSRIPQWGKVANKYGGNSNVYTLDINHFAHAYAFAGNAGIMVNGIVPISATCTNNDS